MLACECCVLLLHKPLLPLYIAFSGILENLEPEEKSKKKKKKKREESGKGFDK